MNKGKLTEAKIVSILKKLDKGQSLKKIAIEKGVSESTIYKWKSKYGPKKDLSLKELKAENIGLRKMHAKLTKENKLIRDLLLKILLSPDTRTVPIQKTSK
ncbi:MAG: transposase [Sediminibacterium sp.]